MENTRGGLKVNNAAFRQQGVLLRTRRKTNRLMGSNELYRTAEKTEIVEASGLGKSITWF